MLIDTRRRATLMAALQYWLDQGMTEARPDHIDTLATNSDTAPALTAEEVQGLMSDIEVQFGDDDVGLTIDDALDHASALMQALRAVLHDSSAVEGEVLLALIRRASELRADVENLGHNMTEDHDEAAKAAKTITVRATGSPDVYRPVCETALALASINGVSLLGVEIDAVKRLGWTVNILERE